MHSASAKNNMEFMNNIGAYRQAAKRKWKPVSGENRGGGGREEQKENNKESKEEENLK